MRRFGTYHHLLSLLLWSSLTGCADAPGASGERGTDGASGSNTGAAEGGDESDSMMTTSSSTAATDGSRDSEQGEAGATATGDDGDDGEDAGAIEGEQEASSASGNDGTDPGEGDSEVSGGEVTTGDEVGTTEETSDGETEGGDASPGCGQPPPPLGEVVEGPRWGVKPDYRYTLSVGTTERSFILRYPKNYDPDHPYPVVMMFHGTGGDGKGFDYTELEQAAGNDAAIFVLPDGLYYEWGEDKGTGWENFNDDERDLELFDALWSHLRTSYCIDESRVFASGHSVGGYFVNYLACERGHVLRGVVPISGGGLWDWFVQDGRCTGPVSAMVVHGNEDNDVPLSEAEVSVNYWLSSHGCEALDPADDDGPCARARGCAAGEMVRYCVYPGVGHSDFEWNIVGPSIWAFFMEL